MACIDRKSISKLIGLGSALALAAASAQAQQRNNSGPLVGGSGPLPNCVAGPNLTVECTGAITGVPLDGTGSSNPLSGPLTYHWEHCPNPNVMLDDPTSATPTFFVDLSQSCQIACQVTLIVRNKNGFANCSILVTVNDTTPPSIACPPDLDLPFGAATDPGSTGSATAHDVCNANPSVAYVDDLSQAPATIRRTWTADDGCETSSCLQTINVAPPRPHLDIKPGSCPNPIYVDDDFGLAVASVRMSLLGNDFDVTQVDIGSLAVERAFFLAQSSLGGQMTPHETSFDDIATPFVGEPCGCNTLGGDGLLDLTLFFHRDELIQTLELGQAPHGTVIELQVTGFLLDNTPFVGTDCVTIIRAGE